VDAVRKARKHLLKHFGKLEFPLGDLQKHVRGEKELPMWGLPEVICAMYTEPWKDGKLRSYLGESYIMLLKYSEEGVEIETVNAYGSSNKPGNKHYTDQMDLFVNQKYKKMTLDREEIFKHAERIYHPGEK
jgi:acyl-homoserine-lactone acylase